jgi:hypothetical protein
MDSSDSAVELCDSTEGSISGAKEYLQHVRPSQIRDFSAPCIPRGQAVFSAHPDAQKRIVNGIVRICILVSSVKH